MTRGALASLLASVLVAACGANGASDPAWPKSAGRMEVDPEKDGGESLEPQQPSHVAAVERAEDRTPAIDADAIVVEAPSPTTGDAKPDAKTEPDSDTKVPTGEIEVIEIKPEDIVIDR